MSKCFWSCRTLRLTEIANVVRAQKGKTYPAGTVFVQVHACKKNTAKIWNILPQDGEIETKYATLDPIVPWIPEYMVMVLEEATPKFMARYVGKNINIAMDDFKRFEFKCHQDIGEQRKVLSLMQPILDSIDQVEREIALNKDAQKWLLEKMMTCISEKLKKAPGGKD